MKKQAARRRPASAQELLLPAGRTTNKVRDRLAGKPAPIFILQGLAGFLLKPFKVPSLRAKLKEISG